MAAGTGAGRRTHHRRHAAQPPQWPSRVGRPGEPSARPLRQPRRGRGGRRAAAADVRPGQVLALLQHQLRRASPGARGGHRARPRPTAARAHLGDGRHECVDAGLDGRAARLDGTRVLQRQGRDLGPAAAAGPRGTGVHHGRPGPVPGRPVRRAARRPGAGRGDDRGARTGARQRLWLRHGRPRQRVRRRMGPRRWATRLQQPCRPHPGARRVGGGGFQPGHPGVDGRGGRDRGPLRSSAPHIRPLRGWRPWTSTPSPGC